ncbi:MAG: septum formation family protein [Mycobacterium sp.]|uniref:septum formation family protein n=1 Tax=Mycobacterium sp. TaxID=1785 RepID=UPI001EC794D6|nr:septum formation family protein [Mycobacterium sp.]MBV8786970.1 septum formation family protein [Mycobacterium sp.]
MERMSQAPEKEAAEAPDASEADTSTVAKADRRSAGFQWPRSLQATATRRALLLTALGGLLIAGVVTAIPVGGPGQGRLAGYLDSDPVPSTGGKSSAAFNRASSGECLMWPATTPESASIVNCADDHKFEVAESLDMRTFPGAEYGPNAAPPSPARIQQITQEQCESAVRNYLGPKFDPNSKFIVSLLWPGDRAWRQSGDRRMLCGLQLPGINNQQDAFKGKVADVDQSKVWPAGTCLGVDPATNQPVDVPVDCGAPHAMEVTGTVNLAEKFPGGLPSEADQDSFVKDSCTKMTDAYLAPVKLRTTTLTLIYPTVSLSSWTAGSREIACSIGATLGNGGWATLVNGAKGQLLINGQPPVPPPDIPEERLTTPPIPLQTQAPAPQQSSAGQSSPTPEVPPNNQHLPGQQPQQPVVTPPRAQQPQAPAPQAPPDGGAPPPPADGGAPPPAAPPPAAPPPPEAPPAEPPPGG